MTAREKKCLAIAVPGIVFVAWRMYGLLVGGGPASAGANPPQPNTPALQPVVAAPASRPIDGRLVRQIEIENGPWTRDPFASPHRVQELPTEASSQPISDAAPEPPALRLTGISESAGVHSALVGGRVVRVGSSIQPDIEVTDITARTLTLRRGRWEFVYRLGAMTPETRLAEQP